MAESDNQSWIDNWFSILDGESSAGSFGEQEIAQQISKLTGREMKSFPVYFSFATIPVDVLLLDSNRRPSGWPVTNAIGLVGAAQLARARSLVAGRDPRRLLLIALHHHIVPPISIEAPLLVCIDYRQVLSLMTECGAAAIIHGHTHMPYIMNLPIGSQRLRILSCGSTMFPAGGPLAKEIEFPSCFGFRIKDGCINDPVLLYRHAPNEPH
jgi:hypothetical protein